MIYKEWTDIEAGADAINIVNKNSMFDGAWNPNIPDKLTIIVGNNAINIKTTPVIIQKIENDNCNFLFFNLRINVIRYNIAITIKTILNVIDNLFSSYFILLIIIANDTFII